MSGILNNLQNNTSYALALHSKAMAELQEQAYTGSRINRASDEPSTAYRVLGLQSQQKLLGNYMNNISDIIGTLEQSSTVLDSMAGSVSDIKIHLTQIVSGTYGQNETGQAARQRLADEVNDALEEMVNLANTAFMGRFVFGGSDTSSAPYEVQRTNGQISSVTYQGSYQDTQVEVASGVKSGAFYVGDEIFRSDKRQVPEFSGTCGAAAGSGTSNIKGLAWLTVTDDGSGSYNLSIDGGTTNVNVAAAADITNIEVKNATGEVLYVDASGIGSSGTEMVQVSGSYDLFNTLIEIRGLLNNEKNLPESEVIDLINKFSAPLEELRSLLVEKQVSMGSKIGFLDDMKNSLDDVKFHAEDEVTSLQEADIAQVAIDLSRREVLYQMSLSVAGKLMSISLLDYI